MVNAEDKKIPPAGYKQTEVGVIPQDWEVKKLQDGIKLLSGHHVLAQHCNTDGIGFPYITGPADFPDGIIQNTKFTDKPTTICRTKDILVTVKGSGAGTMVLADDQYCISRQLMAIRVAHWDTRYIYYSLRREASLFESAAAGLIPGLSRGDILSTQIAVPPTIEEQVIISSGISDVDALILALDQTIDKKRALKQGAMQELLTGKRRMPGFGVQSGYMQTEVGKIPADWTVRQLKEVTRTHRQGFYTKNRYVDRGVRLVRITDLMNPIIDYEAMPMLRISEADYDLYKIKIGDFLFARSGAIGRYGIVYDDVEAVFGSYIIRFCFDSAKLKNEYFGFLYETNIVKEQLLAITQGSSNININATNIKAIKIPLPDIDEQTAIASLLSDIDSEIRTMEQKLAKYKALKQGMMQVLLTGKIRLPHNNALGNDH